MPIFNLSNGATFTGSLEQARRVVDALGLPDKLGPTYKSSTQGTIFISDMQTSHIRNAILKTVRENLEDALRAMDNNQLGQLAQSFRFMPQEFQDLGVELFLRSVREKTLNTVASKTNPLDSIRSKWQ